MAGCGPPPGALWPVARGGRLGLLPGHLPKHEKIGDATFMIVRAYDEQAEPGADTVPWMTRKIALLLANRFLLTIHRRKVPLLGPILDWYRRPEGPVYLQTALLDVLAAAVETFGAPLDEIESDLHRYEQAVLTGQTGWNSWEDVFRTKSRLMIIKRLLWHTLSTVQKFIPFSSANVPLCQDVRERIESLHFFATGLLDDLNSLLGIQMALASNRTADIMKVLAIFSVVFLPVTFIVGIYGMNFEMPELTHQYGYPAVWATMIAVSLGIYVWGPDEAPIRWDHRRGRRQGTLARSRGALRLDVPVPVRSRRGRFMGDRGGLALRQCSGRSRPRGQLGDLEAVDRRRCRDRAWDHPVGEEVLPPFDDRHEIARLAQGNPPAFARQHVDHVVL